jgi:HK97 family phage prohead protease
MSTRTNLKKEVRTFTSASPLEIRTAADGSKQLAGYAIRYNSRSQDLGGFTEVGSPGMLTRTLKQNKDVLCLRDHRSELLLGRTTAGTLTLTEDKQGLAFVVTLPRTAIGDDTAENVRLRNLSGCSFGFVAVDDDWKVQQNGMLTRTLLDVDLFEISITSFPAYSSTSVDTRSCPAELRSKLTTRESLDDIIFGHGNNADDDDADGCSCQCGLPGCASLPDDDDDEDDDDNLETDSRALLTSLIMRRMQD